MAAFLGLGHMGQAMVKRLVSAGFHLRVWDRTPGKAAPAPGLEVCGSPQEAVRGAPFVVTSLANDEAVREVTFAFIDAMEPDAVHVGTSTISWSLAKVLAGMHPKKGSHYVGAPVLGRPDAAERGELWILVGGEPAVARRCQPIFDAIGHGTIAADTAPDAHLTKIIANFMIANTIEMLARRRPSAKKVALRRTG
jgi:3-hydroxyisobutyrate dehydrogenase-like beta-hydroxyacid dehydrogenase